MGRPRKAVPEIEQPWAPEKQYKYKEVPQQFLDKQKRDRLFEGYIKLYKVVFGEDPNQQTRNEIRFKANRFDF